METSEPVVLHHGRDGGRRRLRRGAAVCFNGSLDCAFTFVEGRFWDLGPGVPFAQPALFRTSSYWSGGGRAQKRVVPWGWLRVDSPRCWRRGWS